MSEFQIPTPTVTTPHNFHDPGRSREITYVIGQESEFKTNVVEVAVAHNKDRKEFYATAGPVTIENDPGSPFIAKAYGSILFNRVTIARKPVARFSKKALDEFTDTIVSMVAIQANYDEKLKAMFEGKTEE